MSAGEAIESVIRQHYGRLLASLIHRFRDIELAEDVLQDAALQALKRWPGDGLPPNPPGWLMKVASRKAIDQLRRQNRYAEKQDQIRLLQELDREAVSEQDDAAIEDHRLRLIFTCCHPALDSANRTALTLKTLCGLSTAQIASAFLVAETTLAQRLVRTKAKITKAGIPFEVPPKEALAERIDSVLEVIYLIFNEGYSPSQSDALIDIDLCQEAIYLNHILAQLLPDETEVHGLLALMYFHRARFDARVDGAGEMVDLQRQDRSLWDRQLIANADSILKGTLMKGRPGRYQLQAAISALHCHAGTFEQTDWQQIVLLYHRLEEFEPGPVVRVNMAVALSFAEGPAQALNFLDRSPGIDRLHNYTPYFAARADMLRRLKQFEGARQMYRRAIECCGNAAESRYLSNQLRQMEAA